MTVKPKKLRPKVPLNKLVRILKISKTCAGINIIRSSLFYKTNRKVVRPRMKNA